MSKGRKYLADINVKDRLPDGQGGFSVNWTLLPGAVWLEMNPLKGYQKLKYEKIDSRIDYKFILPFQISIKDGYQIKLGTRTFEVIGPPVNLDERNDKQEILAREIF